MRKFSSILYKLLNWLFILGVMTQVFLVGLVLLARKMVWPTHIGLGHSLGLPLILMLITMYLAKADQAVKRTTWILFVVYIIQAEVIIFLRQSLPLVSAFHPVLALVDFWLAAQLLQMTSKGKGFAAATS